MKQKDLFILTVLLFCGCSSNKILNYSYDETLYGYRAYFKKPLYSPDGTRYVKDIILRDDNGKKIAKKEEADYFVNRYNTKNHKINLYMEPEMSETKKYYASKYYYTGLKEQQDGRYKEAIDFYNNSLRYNMYLKYYSDIYYRLGQCYDALGEEDKAKESYSKFIDYSEKIIPDSFYQQDISSKVIKNLFQVADDRLNKIDQNKNSLDIYPHTYKEIPKLRRPYSYPGFTYGKQKIGLLGLYLGYSSIYGLEYTLGII